MSAEGTKRAHNDGIKQALLNRHFYPAGLKFLISLEMRAVVYTWLANCNSPADGVSGELAVVAITDSGRN